MSKQAAVMKSFKVGKLTCTITIQAPTVGAVTNMVVEWEPGMPRRLSRRQWAEYRAGRDAAFTELLNKMGGGSALVVEV